jgi:hypothetical protein
MRSISTLLYRMRALVAGIVVAAALAPASAGAQVVADTGRGLVGEEVRLALRTTSAIDAADSLTLRGAFHLSNATIFYPERFVGTSQTEVLRSTLVRMTDSTYSFDVVLRAPGAALAPGDTLCMLAGEALTGYDSVCVVSFSGLRANDGPASEARGVIVSRSVGTPLPYVRYATLEPGYPNPARRYQTVTWGFRIDKLSPVRFSIYNTAGMRIAEHDLGERAPGIYVETFTIGFDVATGVYLVGLNTNSGDAWTWMHVVK